MFKTCIETDMVQLYWIAHSIMILIGFLLIYFELRRQRRWKQGKIMVGNANTAMRQQLPRRLCGITFTKNTKIWIWHHSIIMYQKRFRKEMKKINKTKRVSYKETKKHRQLKDYDKKSNHKRVYEVEEH